MQKQSDLRELLANWKGKKVLMTIFPHPDDESVAAGGLLVVAKSLGWTTIVVTLTKGEAGKIHIHGKGRSVKEIRTGELERAVKILGVDKLIVGDFSDGDLKTEEEKYIPWLMAQIVLCKPAIIVTYDHSGFTGHPDHVSLSVSLWSLVKKIGGIYLFWALITEKYQAQFNPEIVRRVSAPSHTLNLGWHFIAKYCAITAHRSQNLGQTLPVPAFLFFAYYRHEWYYRVSLKKRYKYKYYSKLKTE